MALFKGEQLKDAVEVFTSLLNSQLPDSPEALRLKTLLGLSYYGQQQYAEAVPFLREATASDSQNLPFRLFLAHSCLGSKQLQCVLDTYREILNLNAESAEADMLAGEALDEMNDREGATQQFRAAVKANPQEPNVHFGLGYLLWTQSQYEEAAKEFQAELLNVPNHIQAMVYLGDSYIRTSNPDEALPYIQKALELDPKLELAHLNMGIMHADAGRKEEALREFKTAAQLNPNDVNVHWRLARLYQSMGKKQEAAAEFDKTKSLTKAADDSVFSKLKKTDRKPEPTGGDAGTAPDK
ncbi:MAG TPA: tetratricopeptide repeat protein [Terriglobales bacterium]|nr:tetratricopeptide repeat protein [Terriglobales bacterium]